MYLTKEIRKKMEELMNLINPKKAEASKVEEKTEPKVETELSEQKAEVTEPKVETLATEETKVAEETKVETKVEEVALVDVPVEETPAEEGMNIEETVQQLIEAITAIDTRLKAIEDAIGAKAQEIEQKNADLAKQVEDLNVKLAKQNGFKTELKKENKMVDDYYAKIKRQLNK